MLEKLTSADFAPHLNQPFALHYGGETPLDVELTTITDLSYKTASGGERAGRRPFSLIFRGPLDGVLPQHIYSLEHPQMAPMELFLVPIGPDGVGMRYEAIFT